MRTQTKSLMSGWPSTRETKTKSGDPVITVKVDAIRPFFARLADQSSVAAAIIAIPASIYGLAKLGDPSLSEALFAFFAPALVYAAAKFGLYRMLRTTTLVTFTPKQVKASRLIGEHSFDRSMPHKFALYPHEKSSREEEVLSFRDRQKTKWYQRPGKRYFGKSFRLSFDYLDQRNDLMLIYGHKQSQLALSRLNAVDQIMDGYAGKTHGQVLLPESQWQAQPGALHGEF
jgi:hypothetical protein